MLIDPSNPEWATVPAVLEKRLAVHLEVVVSCVHPRETAWLRTTSEDGLLVTIQLRNVSPEMAKVELNRELAGVCPDGLGADAQDASDRLGLFVPRAGSVTCHSFAHGRGHYYRYRLATFKLDAVPERLRAFLANVASQCPPDECFLDGPRASSFGFPSDLQVTLVQSPGHKLSRLAAEALHHRKFRSVHEDIEKYLLDRDSETVACEVPIWLERAEYQTLTANPGPGTLTGHIDVLRCERDDRIGIWDYKPSVADEEHAHVQVYLYALMLSRRTGMGLDRIECGYFDSSVAVSFLPMDVQRLSGPLAFRTVAQGPV